MGIWKGGLKAEACAQLCSDALLSLRGQPA